MNYLPKVLLVDDEVDHIHLLASLLRTNGFDIYSMSNPEGLIEILKTFKPDIIILDIKLGSYDGKEICRQLKDNVETKLIRIILHSAFPEFENEYQLCGADEFILKPTNLSYLISRLTFHLQ